MIWIVPSTVIGMIMAVLMVFIRLKASQKPTGVLRIILPPLFMSTGALMFLFPFFQVSLEQALEAIIVGVIFSIFLIKTSNFEKRQGQVYLIPSKIFIVILIGLLIFRIIIKLIVSQSIPVGETSGMFYLLAFGMIISWRIAMLIKFYKVKKSLIEEG
ncbi:CcdC family protein [Aquibacillus saliphilus]|uniref:CcdC family protein n=1 Tax=Aquibacillus saliphilus TaxID=1909422 RepID=UPI001CEFB4B8|nr:cytochrome c biogenesis protein CcdC [Aquibacillus saliphilus]